MKPAAAVFLCLSAIVTPMCGCAKHPPIKAPGGIVLRSQRISLPAHGREFAGGPQASVANTYCLMCHSGGMVMTQPPLTLSQWQAELRKMIKTNGCPLPQSEVDDLAQFFAHAKEIAAAP